MKVSFPGLGINNIEVPRVFIQIGSFSIYWYAIFITIGIIIALFYAMKNCQKFNLQQDNIFDAIIYGLPCAIIGARLYYVIFSLDEMNSFGEIFNLRNGGLAIFGGVIGAFFAALILSKIKKIKLTSLLDVVSMGFLIGQCIGRWGNFFNGEVYGVETSLPWRMVISNDYATAQGVHPLFLYESLWNLLGFILLFIFIKKSKKRFSGQVALMYVIWYGFGRGCLEGLRNPVFIIKGLFGGYVSQILGFASAIAAALILVVLLKKKKPVKNYVKVFDIDTDKAQTNNIDFNQEENNSELINQNEIIIEKEDENGNNN